MRGGNRRNFRSSFHGTATSFSRYCKRILISLARSQGINQSPLSPAQAELSLSVLRAAGLLQQQADTWKSPFDGATVTREPVWELSQVWSCSTLFQGLSVTAMAGLGTWNAPGITSAAPHGSQLGWPQEIMEQ